MHYYSFNIKDYRKDTGHLTPMEHYIYRFLMDWYYMDEKPITTEHKKIMRRLSLKGDEQEELLVNVLGDFFHLEDDGYHHKRIDQEIVDYQLRAETNRKNGKKGGRPPKNKAKKTQSVNSDNPKQTEEKQTLTENNLNQEPITNNQEPINYNNNNDSNSESDFCFFSVKNWQPDFNEVKDKLAIEAPAIQFDQQWCSRHLNKFVNYYYEEEVKGEGIVTEDRCSDLYIDWLKREYIFEQKKSATAQPSNNGQTWDDRNYQGGPKTSTTSQPANTSKPQNNAVRDARVSAILNGEFFEPLPGMNPRETEHYVNQHKKPGELSDEAYYRIRSQD